MLIAAKGLASGTMGSLKDLIRFYENCVLQSDGIRFKKSSNRESIIPFYEI